MSVAPPTNAPNLDREARRARLAVLAAGVGIAAILVAYALAPGVRHAVGHAAHSVRHAVTRVFDPDGDNAEAVAAHGHSAAKGAAPAPAKGRSPSQVKRRSPSQLKQASP
jgi:hypothetical protein